MKRRLGHIASRVTTLSSEPRPFVALEHISGGTGHLTTDVDLLNRDIDSHGTVAFEPGDVLFGKLRPYLRKSWRATFPGSCSTELIVMRAQDGIDARWLGYVAQNDALVSWAIATSDGVKMPRTSWEKLRMLELDIPSAAQQQAVADYLDAETARIDALADRYGRLINLQMEKRTAITIRGVEGRFLSGSRRTSRLTYLETVPDRWDEVRLSLLAKLGSGHTPSREHPEWWVDAAIPWITTGEVWQLRDDRVEYVSETRENVSELGIANSAAELHPAGTVFLSRTASAGFSGIMACDMATSQDFVTWTCGPRVRPRFLLLCLRAMRGDLLGRLAMGSTHKTIYFPDIQSIKVPLPPVEEQDQILDSVWARLRAIDGVVDAIQRQVSLLHERRRAVITAAVTGQLEIPGVAA